jgi:hypothetical protein
MKKLLLLIVVFTMTFVLKSEAKPVRFFVDIEWGISDGKGGCEAKIFRFCSLTIGLRSKGNSDFGTMESSGEVRNNMLVINLPKEIRGEGNNSPGTYTYTLSKQMDLDADLAKELGFEKLSIAPGNYAFSGNTISLKIISPRDISTGQSSGKRLLPTVNKKDIAIDEQGVH